MTVRESAARRVIKPLAARCRQPEESRESIPNPAKHQDGFPALGARTVKQVRHEAAIRELPGLAQVVQDT
jgi:hypothetical protein